MRDDSMLRANTSGVASMKPGTNHNDLAIARKLGGVDVNAASTNGRTSASSNNTAALPHASTTLTVAASNGAKATSTAAIARKTHALVNASEPVSHTKDRGVSSRPIDFDDVI